MWAVLGRSSDLCGRSRAALGTFVGNLALLLGPCGRSWAALVASVGGLGLFCGPLRAVLRRSWDLCWRSWAAVGAYVGNSGPLLVPMLAVLGRLGTYDGGPGPSWVLCWRFWGGTRPETDPTPSGRGRPFASQG